MFSSARPTPTSRRGPAGDGLFSMRCFSFRAHIYGATRRWGIQGVLVRSGIGGGAEHEGNVIHAMVASVDTRP
jgi:hypothetical protein